MSIPTSSRRWRRAAPLALLAALALASGAVAKGGNDDDGDKALKLRLDDVVGKPGGTVALVIRTYAARPIRKGRITITVSPPAGRLAAEQVDAPFGLSADAVTQPARPLTIQRVVVFSVAGDATSTPQSGNGASGQSLGVSFSSSSATVNAADGPLAVIYARLDPAAKPGSRYLLSIDAAATGLTDPAGKAIATEPLQAVLRVRAANAPLDVAAEGDKVRPGELAELGLETVEPFAVKGGRMTLRYDASLAAGAPTVSIDPRYGRATWTADSSRPGVLVVDFTSSDSSLNGVPGRLIAVALPIKASAPVGLETPLTLDPRGTWLLAPSGKKRPLRIENDTLSIR
jgi:hypothetical protein